MRAEQPAAPWRPAGAVALRACLLLALICCSAPVHAASQVWAQVGEGELRSDLMLLDDAGLINLPLNDWPVPLADIDRVMQRLDPTRLRTQAQKDAYARIEERLAPSNRNHFRPSEAGIAGGKSGLLRDFDTLARDDGGAYVSTSAYGYRWAAELTLDYSFSPADHQPVRLDGSNLTTRLGNWLLSLNTLDKWWGPGDETSLILSNNARPIPVAELERATSEPFDFPVLRWFGPWRLIVFVGEEEQNRPDVRDALFFGNRLSFKPTYWLEIAGSRTTQFCGSGRPCNLTVWRNTLIGNDTTQYSGNIDKPGHAQAGYEFRVSDPFRELPLAFYYQAIGNDEINRLPARLMKQYGLDSWVGLGNGDTLRGFVEYTDSTCGAGRSGVGGIGIGSTAPGPQFDCAYYNTVFFAGYRYRDLNIGDTADMDAILRTVGLRWERSAGDEWQLKLQSGHFDRGNVLLAYDPVSPTGGSLYDSVQVQYRRALFGGTLAVQLGAERQNPPEAIGDGRAFGYISWSRPL
ncbi:MAG TPA: capsule assembly Wzi family protein [Steroidobacteraceae bacterium]|nr:capsule assembly Wzi family protein [Steroidobacteraceae bacterium]